jgi:hypothetical protein
MFPYGGDQGATTPDCSGQMPQKSSILDSLLKHFG